MQGHVARGAVDRFECTARSELLRYYATLAFLPRHDRSAMVRRRFSQV